MKISDKLVYEIKIKELKIRKEDLSIKLRNHNLFFTKVMRDSDPDLIIPISRFIDHEGLKEELEEIELQIKKIEFILNWRK